MITPLLLQTAVRQGLDALTSPYNQSSLISDFVYRFKQAAEQYLP